MSDDGKSYVWLHKRLTISGHQVLYLLQNKNDQDADIYRKVFQECINPQTVRFYELLLSVLSSIGVIV